MELPENFHKITIKLPLIPIPILMFLNVRVLVFVFVYVCVFVLDPFESHIRKLLFCYGADGGGCWKATVHCLCICFCIWFCFYFCISFCSFANDLLIALRSHSRSRNRSRCQRHILVSWYPMEVWHGHGVCAMWEWAQRLTGLVVYVYLDRIINKNVSVY